jgi:hypothetical protein
MKTHFKILNIEELNDLVGKEKTDSVIMRLICCNPYEKVHLIEINPPRESAAIFINVGIEIRPDNTLMTYYKYDGSAS